MKITLSPDKREVLRGELGKFLLNEFDHDLSDFKLDSLIDFVLERFGAVVHNDALKDAHAYLAEKLNDMETDLFAEERQRKVKR